MEVGTKSEPPQIKDIDKIQSLCVSLTKAIVDGKSGIDEKEIAELEERRKNYKLVLLSYRKPNEISKGKQREIEEKSLKNISQTESEIGIELTEALIDTSKMINETDPVLVRDNKPQKPEYVDTCTEANRKFTDFFIKIHKKLSLTDEEVMGIYDTIFAKVGLDSELKAKALERFPGGVLAAIRAYLEISKNLPGWNIDVASFEEDKYHGTDLVAISSDHKEKRLYDVKGGASFEDIKILEVTHDNEMDKARTQMVTKRIVPPDKQSGIMESIYKIHEYALIPAREMKRAFIILAPSS